MQTGDTVPLNLTPDELLTTTRTVRKRLDFERPVPRTLIEECIEIALQAPTGGFKQNWHWIAISDPKIKDAIAEIYRASWVQTTQSGRMPTYGPDDPRATRIQRVLESGTYLADNIGRAPWLIIPCGTGRTLDQPTVPEQSRFWASILPAMWNFMLAARARGLGCAWTTEHLKHEDQVARILNIPQPEVTQCGLLPVAFSKGTDFRRAQRIPGVDVTHWDTW
jgi:nitroreductase